MSKHYKQFYMFKFNSSRLHKDNYNINLTVKQSQKNDEFVALGDNQLFRTIRQIQRREIDTTNKKTLFMPEVITVVIEKLSHYKYMAKEGVTINGTKYKRFLCGAGHARNNTVYFLDETIYQIVSDMFKNGHSDELKINPSKYNAYFGLYASASQVVNTPRVCVVSDFKYKRNFKVDFIDGDNVTLCNKELEVNPFDGQGLVSYEMASAWGENLNLKYTPSEFIIRAPFIKGMVATFDFHTFAKTKEITTIKDLWDKTYNIEDIDLILSESQFKLWNGYTSWKSYEQNCNKNNLQWSVSRVSPKKDKDVAFTNYQYLQTLNLTDEDIIGICKPTADWLKDVATDREPMKALLFLLGENCDSLEDILSLKDNDIGKAVVFNNNALKHPYVKNRIYNMIERKMKDACMGKLAVKGNYSIMVADPYAQCEHALGLPVQGLLEEDEHYSNYWIQQDIYKVDACRSPMTHYSEHKILSLKKNTDTQYWYGHLNSGIIINAWGDDCVRFADADFDGDILMTTDNKYFLKGVQKDTHPITYNKNSAPKEKISYEKCCKADLSSFDTKIGTITNYSTSLYCIESKFAEKEEENIKELAEIRNRIKILRREQGNQIDKAKGIQITGFPLHWVKWSKITEIDTPEERLAKNFNNNIIIEKKPYFMTYVYPHLMKEYKKWYSDMDKYCRTMFGYDLEILQRKQNLTQDEQYLLNNYNKFIPVDKANCVMNKLCWHMEKTLNEIKNWKTQKEDVNYLFIGKETLKNWNEDTFRKIKAIFNLNKVTDYHEGMDTSHKYELIKEEMLYVCPNEQELVQYCLAINDNLVWQLKLDTLINNIYNNRQETMWIPVPDEEGNINYLNKNYSRKVIEAW